MESEERDFVTFTDDEGNDFELDVIDYFEYEGQEYAVLIDLGGDEGCECGEAECECEHEHEVYIMKIVVDGENEEFLPVDEDKFDILAAIVDERLTGEGDGCECGDECDCGDEECGHKECDCGCKHE